MDTDRKGLFDKKAHCCGCGACMNICPKNAISMVEDEAGFVFPAIDEQKCVHCDLCKRVCNYQNKQAPFTMGKTYAAMAKNSQMVERSASGGVFAAIAAQVLKAGGVVFGCALDTKPDIHVHHIKIDQLEDLEKLQGSKYLQSDIGMIYKEVKCEVATGHPVLFSGTPCQIAGLKGFLMNQIPDNLLLIDIICHGVGSQALFKAYLDCLAQKKKGTIENYSFRDKTAGWGLHARVDVQRNGNDKQSYFIQPGFDSYYWLFLKSEIYRENCYECSYASANRPGDITIGDYWGIEKEHPEILKKNGGIFDENLGVSCIIINSDRGQALLEQYGQGIALVPSTFEQVSRWNKQLNAPSKHTGIRQQVLDSYKKKGYKGVERTYLKVRGWKYPLKVLRNHLVKNKRDW